MSDRVRVTTFDSEGVLAVITIIVVFATLVFGLTTCSEHEAALKKVCIESGGSVIPEAAMSFRCVDPKVKP